MSGINRDRQAGVAIIETVLVLLPLLVTFFGVIELGRLLLVQQTLSNAAREGATFGVRPLTGGAQLPSEGQITTVVRNYLVPANLTDATVSVERPVYINSGVVTGEFTRVRVTTTYRVVTISMFADVQTVLAGEALMRNETSP